MSDEAPVRYYETPPAGDRPPRELTSQAGTPLEERYTFYDRMEIGRYHEGQVVPPGVLLVCDATVSSRHCVITQTAEGQCFVRDLSRNGTRLEGRRLVPNVEVEIRPGQGLQIGRARSLVLAGKAVKEEIPLAGFTGTQVLSGLSMVTVLVGDIRDYTEMSQVGLSSGLQQSVRRVFHRLEREIEAHHGTLKEFQGDAIFAFWEKGPNRDYAVAACRAAVALDRLALQLADDRSIWDVDGFPLNMDWALVTGPVVIDVMGGERPTGLSMVGEPVVRAYRTEKMADDTTGSVLACEMTQELAERDFLFKPLGKRSAKGFETPRAIFSLVGAREP